MAAQTVSSSRSSLRFTHGVRPRFCSSCPGFDSAPPDWFVVEIADQAARRLRIRLPAVCLPTEPEGALFDRVDLELSTEQPFTEVATPTWRDLGSCRKSPVDFFPFAEDAQAIRLAKDVGDLCPVIDDCLAYAIETRQSDGVWGGLTPKEQLYLRRRWMEHNRAIAEMKRETFPRNTGSSPK